MNSSNRPPKREFIDLTVTDAPTLFKKPRSALDETAANELLAKSLADFMTMLNTFNLTHKKYVNINFLSRVIFIIAMHYQNEHLRLANYDAQYITEKWGSNVISNLQALSYKLFQIASILNKWDFQTKNNNASDREKKLFQLFDLATVELNKIRRESATFIPTPTCELPAIFLNNLDSAYLYVDNHLRKIVIEKFKPDEPQKSLITFFAQHIEELKMLFPKRMGRMLNEIAYETAKDILTAENAIIPNKHKNSVAEIFMTYASKYGIAPAERWLQKRLAAAETRSQDGIMLSRRMG